MRRKNLKQLIIIRITKRPEKTKTWQKWEGNGPTKEKEKGRT